MADILIVDDDKYIQEMLSINATRLGHQAMSAGTISEGLAMFESKRFGVVFLDVRLPDGNGLEMLSKIRQHPESPEVVIITGAGDEQGAELAIKNGAWDYLQKPFSRQMITLLLQRTIEYRQHKLEENRRVVLNTEEIIGKSVKLQNALKPVAQCAKSDANVIIYGETGTGKEVFAKAIHINSDRAGKPFIVVDCTVLPDNLAESILFGHVKGAFTGATENRTGLIQQANNGTLFLDEIGDLNLSLQKTLLRVLQERRFRPVGSNRNISSNFRLVSATHRNIEEMVDKGLFRQDLFYRLRTFAIELPPLRERKEDIEELTQHYIQMICKKNGFPRKGFAPELLDVLESYDWPGNVRELVAAIEMTILADVENPILYPIHLPEHIRLNHIQSKVNLDNRTHSLSKSLPASEKNHNHGLFDLISTEQLIPLKEFRRNIFDIIEKRYLERLMMKCGNDIQQACKISGLQRARLYELMRKYNIYKNSNT